MKKVLLKFNKIFLLVLAIICTNNVIFAQEYEAKMTSKKLYEYIMNKKQKKNHTLKISYSINAYIDKYYVCNISNDELTKLGYFDGNDKNLYKYINENEIPKIKEIFNTHNLKYNNLIIICSECNELDDSTNFNISIVFDFIDELTIICKYDNFNNDIVDFIKDSIISDANLKLAKLHDNIEFQKVKINKSKYKWELISDF